MAGVSSVTIGDRVDGGVYIDVGGRRIWHFCGGDPSGPPVVLLHGAFGSASTWGAQFSDFIRAGLSIFAPERSGHGHSPDHDGPFTLDDMVAETIGYLERAVGAPAHLVGWSDGAVIALLVARSRPDLVSRVVATSTYINQTGHDAAEFLDLIRSRHPATVEFLRDGYVAVTPDGPEHFGVVYDKTFAMLEHEPDFDLSVLAGVAASTLVVAPDHGVGLLDHVLDMVRALPKGRLAVLPGTHILPVEAPELFNPLVVSFLAADPPHHWVPYR
ncbi:alpha/beta hydrolase [Gordonia sp. GW1C4-4]|jgi:pimeloyl-ACP methyl ester carboxylesterase|uniref:Alpha/beta hydrolase n=2 Tax=Gordonia TaxID=2053 RepID=A0A9X3D379_9ACTN|nr:MULTISPECIES: alpha/beta hydrolase [Gordonia]MAU84537.1 alpha/beta hydrolase [Gordonia sp. (in: high G+C Gram-positive bacteria)]MCF3939416.1 alpha/beta hydrolase [Gordonia tangerina]MCX2962986.1 alpha/beta hydrolase [Gordonia aquimaris]